MADKKTNESLPVKTGKAKEMLVLLKTKDANGKQKEGRFPIDVANRLLAQKIKKWELSDSNFKYNGKELVKN